MPRTFPRKPKNIYHIIPESRMSGLLSFSSWKERKPDCDNLADFERSLARDIGNRMANELASHMRETGESFIPSVAVRTESLLLHLPPKISYLFMKAAGRPPLGTSARKQEIRAALLEALSEDLSPERAEPGGVGIALLKDISMGNPRINSVCCSDEKSLGNWMNWLEFMDPLKSVRVLRLEGIRHFTVDSEACSGAAEEFRRLFGFAGQLDLEMLISALFEGKKPYGHVADALEQAAEWGRIYANRGSVSYDPELIIKLPGVARGSFLSKPEITQLVCKEFDL